MARSFEVQEFPAVQRRIKAAQRVGIGVLALVLLAAVAGLTGLGGPLSDTRARHAGIDVQTPRFARYLAPTSIAVEVERAAADTVTLTLRGDHADAFHVKSILPEPERVATTGDATIYTFTALPGEPHRIRLDGQMETIGPVVGSLRVGDGQAIAVNTFVFP